MTRLVAWRLLALAPLLFVVSVLTFLLVQLIPGDPRDTILGPDATPQQYEALGDQLGLDDPILLQYGRWVGGAVRGDLGRSAFNSQPVTEAIFDRVPVTLSLTAGALVVSLLIGLPAGVLAGSRPGSIFDRIAVVVATIGQSVPAFWLALLLVIPLALWWQLFPATGYVPLLGDPVGWVKSIALGSIALGTAGGAGLIRHTRGAIVGVLGQDYIRTARAKGISPRRVLFKHALKNAAVPMVTVLAFEVNALLGGSLIVEGIFGLNGFGNLAITSVRSHDIPMVQGVVIAGTVVIVAVNLLLDLAYSYLNPRIRPS